MVGIHRHSLTLTMHFPRPTLIHLYFHPDPFIVGIKNDAVADACFKNQNSMSDACILTLVNAPLSSCAVYVLRHIAIYTRIKSIYTLPMEFPLRGIVQGFSQTCCAVVSIYLLKLETGAAYLSFAIRPEIHAERDHVVDRGIGGLV